ncbi:MAG TPA: ATP-binding protein, partial [Candidatus Omnitrophica bacterium]|nr:ATP-binding protein [Candidatus Omnitrophota bacterium]
IYPEACRIDLLKSDLVIRYLQRPWVFREEVMALKKHQLVIIDEVQKAPMLLDEVHYLIQEEGRVFVMCGSSARKVKRGHANLLGGRAIRYELLGLSAVEIGKSFNLTQILNSGPIPSHYLSEKPQRMLQSYVDDYLKEEILQEGLIRSLPVFSDFLRVAAIGDTETVNLSNIARESGVSANTVRDHYGILVDTLLGAFLPAYTRRPKRRSISAPKFYFRDVGIVNYLSKRGTVQPGSELFGKAFENWVFNEISIHSRYSEKFYDISYWRLTTGIEVDFILGAAEIAVEAKAKEKITINDLKGLRQFKQEYPGVKHCIVVSLEKQSRLTEDGIWIVPYLEFIQKLWAGEWKINCHTDNHRDKNCRAR